MEEQNNVLEIMMRMSRSLKRHHSGGRRHFNGGHRILRVLKQEGPIHAKELAERLDIRPASLSEALDRLESKELIVRSTDENDKRKVLISLSDKANEMMEKRRERKDEREQIINAALTAQEQEEFIRLGQKLIDALHSDKE